MNLHAAEVSALAEIIARLESFAQPADLVLRTYFREHPKLGQKERARLAETAFGWLRRKRSLNALAGDEARANAILALNRIAGLSVRELAAALSARESTWLRERLAQAPAPAPALQAELPDWLYLRLASQWGVAECQAFAHYSQQPAALDLRVNTQITTREDLQAALAATSIQSEFTPYSPLGLRISGKPALQNHPLFRAGHFEVQDEGSQLVTMLLNPGRHQLVVDFCAGAGGKTLALAAAMRGQGQIFAFDLAERRLRSLRERVTRGTFSNVQPWQIADENDPKLARLAAKADKVLVDAPCSGFGTLRRNPDLKWRHAETAVTELARKQARILSAAARLVKPGGRLVYATCSILAEENEAVVEGFLREQPGFRLQSAAEILAHAKIKLDTGVFLQLLPQRHGCDGFFAAVLRRQE
ncbi:MAG: RsmB/NOP family class I SAM-dependent RNA methyltransferase [Betaproteobacteria bacterium]|nr:RsmB/NOP family class I SAM-dependent RNA methyltransferase [Betaproteobacteria bacterium]